MKTIKRVVVVLLFVFPFFYATAFALDYFEVSKPTIKKAAIYVSADTDSTLNRQFIIRLKKMLAASLLFENVDSKRNSDYSITLGNSIEAKDLLVTIVGEKQNTFKTKFFGIRFQSTDRDYVTRRTSQMANRIIKEFFGIEGSIGSTLTWSVTEESRKVIYKESFAVDNSQKQVTFNFYSNYGGSWNPSQDHIIYTSHTDFGTVMNVQQVEPLVFNSTEVFKQSGQASSPIWAPDATIYLTLHVSDQNSDIFQFKLNGNLGGSEPVSLTRIRQLTDNASIETEPALSPDNTKMAYVSDRTSEPQIYIMDLSGKKSTRLTQKGNYNVSPSWSPNGNYLAFRSIRDGVSSIYRIDLSTNEETVLTGKEIETEDPTWSPDGSLIVFTGKTNNKATSKIYYMLSSGGEFRRLTDSGASVEETSPNWGPALR
jgi:TolB protein